MMCSSSRLKEDGDDDVMMMKYDHNINMFLYVVFVVVCCVESE